MLIFSSTVYLYITAQFKYWNNQIIKEHTCIFLGKSISSFTLQVSALAVCERTEDSELNVQKLIQYQEQKERLIKGKWRLLGSKCIAQRKHLSLSVNSCVWYEREKITQAEGCAEKGRGWDLPHLTETDSINAIKPSIHKLTGTSQLFWELTTVKMKMVGIKGC